jgi:integrase
MRKTLTDAGVRALKARSARYPFPDPELRGHYVRVTPNGAKSFVVVSRDPSGKQVWHTLGNADAMAIDDAREQAREAIRRIRDGLPVIEPAPAMPDAFKLVAEDWIKRHVKKRKLRTRSEIERCLRKYVYPRWAERAFTGIKRSDIAGLLDHVEDEHGSRQADIVLEIIRGISNWYATRHDDYLSPFVRNMARHNDKGGRARVLDDDELRAVWKQAEANGSFGALVRVLLLTAQRRGAVLSMRWQDIDTDGVWTIPRVEREKINAGILKLPAQALAIINAQPRFASNPYVFAASRGNGPMNGFSKSKDKFDAACGVNSWTLHDLRRCARSLLSRAGVRPDIAERTLGHVIGGIEGTYDRHEFLDEKADALRRLAMLIEGIVHPHAANVLPLINRR